MVLIVVGLLFLQKYFAKAAKKSSQTEQSLFEWLNQFKQQKLSIDELKERLKQEADRPDFDSQFITKEIESFSDVYDLPELKEINLREL